MNELDERIVNLEASSENTAERLVTLERDVGLLKVQCASKVDLAEAKAEILIKVAETANVLRTEIGAVAGKVDATENKLRTEINATENKLRTEINATESKLRTEIIGVESRLTTAITGVREGVRTEIAQAKNWLLFWVVVSVFLAQLLPDMLKKLGLA